MCISMVTNLCWYTNYYTKIENSCDPLEIYYSVGALGSK